MVAQVFKTCCAADFRIGVPQAGWETRDTADLGSLRYKNQDALLADMRAGLIRSVSCRPRSNAAGPDFSGAHRSLALLPLAGFGGLVAQ